MIKCEPQDWITSRIAASKKYLNLSPRRIAQMCLANIFPSAHKPGAGPNAHWRILRSEVIAHKFNNHKRHLGE